jgi:hypothetical protein
VFKELNSAKTNFNSFSIKREIYFMVYSINKAKVIRERTEKADLILTCASTNNRLIIAIDDLRASRSFGENSLSMLNSTDFGVKMNWTICSLRLSKDWIAETIERERT